MNSENHDSDGLPEQAPGWTPAEKQRDDFLDAAVRIKLRGLTITLEVLLVNRAAVLWQKVIGTCAPKLTREECERLLSQTMDPDAPRPHTETPTEQGEIEKFGRDLSKCFVRWNLDGYLDDRHSRVNVPWLRNRLLQIIFTGIVEDPVDRVIRLQPFSWIVFLPDRGPGVSVPDWKRAIHICLDREADHHLDLSKPNARRSDPAADRDNSRASVVGELVAANDQLRRTRRHGHFEWLARYQVGHEGLRAIARSIGSTHPAVHKAIHHCADLIHLPLRAANRGGRPRRPQ